MAISAINIRANAQEVINLRRKIDELSSALTSMQRSANPALYDKLNRELQRTTVRYNNLRTEVNQYVREQERASKSTNEMLNLFAKIGGTTAIIGLGKQIMDVRNEFQQLEIAFGTMLKSEEKAATLMKDLTKFAAETPFGLQSAASGAKQLLAYGSTADTVIKELTMLGDVAAGTGQQIGDLVYLYGTLRTQGRAYLMDIRQFAGRGIPIYDELAKVLNTSKDKVNEFVSAGKVGFKEVEQAFKNMTAQGGLYGGLMEEQSKSIGGRMEALKDNIDSIFNAIGKNNEGVIYGAIDGLNTLVENYETVGKILIGLVATYGTYRTAVMLATIAESGWTIAQMAHFKALVVVEKAQKLLNATMLSNPYVLAVTVLIGLVATMWALRDSTTEAEKAQERYNKVKDDAIQKEKEHKNKIEELISTATNQALADMERTSALEELKKKYPEIFEKYDIETLKLADILKLKKEIAEIDNKKSVEDRKAKYDTVKADRNVAQENYDNLVKKYGSSINYRGIISEAKKRLDGLNKDLALYEKDVQADRSNAFITNLNKLSKEQLQAELTNRERLVHELNKKGGNKANIEGFGELSLDAIKSQTQAIQTELDKRNVAYFNYSDLHKKLTKELADEEAKLAKIRSNESKYSEVDFKKVVKDQKEIVDLKKKELQEFTGVTDKTQQKAESAAEKARKQADKMREASLKLLNLQAELDNESVKQQLDYEQKLLDIEQDSFDKRYRLNQLNAAKEFLSVEEYRQKMSKAQQDAAKDIYVKNNGSDTGFNFDTFDKSLLPEGLKSSDIEAQAKNMMDTIVVAYKKGNEDIIRDRQIFWNEENMMFASELDKQLDSIRTHYEQRRKEAENDAELLKKINENEVKEISSARLQARQKQLEADAEYNQKYTQLVTDRYIFEADKRKASLQQQIKDQEAIINNLSDQLLNDPNNDELANKLKAAKLELKLFNKELEKTSADKFTEVVSGISDIASTLRSALDDFGVSFSDSANQVLDGGMQILDGAGKMAKGIRDMDISSFIQGMITQTQGYFNVIGGLFGPNGTAEYEGIKSQLEAINKIYESIIANSKEDIVFGGGFASINAASTALDNYTKKVENLKKIAQASGGAGAAWNSHSAGWHTNKNVGTSNFLEMGKIIDKSVTSISDLYNLTGDELYLIQSQMPEAWGLIDERIRENLQSIIDCKDEAKELKDALNEALTGVSQDAFYNDFINNLSNMETSFEDMCDNFEDYLRKSIIAAMVASTYKPRIDALYQNWSDAANSEGRITEDEANKLKEEYQRIVEQMMKDREDLADSFGWDSSGSSQSASKGGFETMSQDTATALEGRFTSMQMRLISIDQNVARIAQWNQPVSEKFNFDTIAMPLGALSQSSLRIERMMEENRNIAIQMFYLVRDIKGDTANLSGIKEGIDSMNNKLDNI